MPRVGVLKGNRKECKEKAKTVGKQLINNRPNLMKGVLI